MLEAAGYDVTSRERRLCCGRPLYDYGMLDLAKVLLREILDDAAARRSRPARRSSASSRRCVSVFSDELLNLFPNDHDARRLSAQTMMLGDFLDKAERWTPPQLHRKVVLHGHCHHKSVLGMDGTRGVLRKLGVELDEPDDGCCGMAGAFGFEAGEHYDVSIKVGELAFLPKVRATEPDAIVIGDGFSCREQMVQTTDRQGLHLADVIWLAMRHGPEGPPGAFPEYAAMPDVRAQRARGRTDGALALGALALAGGFALSRVVRRRDA